MSQWLIKIVGKQRADLDKDLLVQAMLAIGRKWKRQRATAKKKTAVQEAAAPEDAA